MGKAVTVNPLKTSPALGAAFALQGVRGAIPLFHAAPGCTFLGKVLLTQHTREPVALLGTDMKEMSTIFGAWDLLETKILETAKKQSPEVIAVISMALSDVRGEDVDGALAAVREKRPDLNVIHISAPDFKGGFGDGFASVLLQLLRAFAKGNPQPSFPESTDDEDHHVTKSNRGKGDRRANRINLIAGPFLTPGDLEEIKEMAELFGLEATAFPDLSLSMDGSKDRFSAKAVEGTTIEDLAKSGSAAATIVLGRGMAGCGHYLEEAFGVPLYVLDSIHGITATDRIVAIFMEVAGGTAPAKIRQWRNRLVDAMVDTHALLYGKRVALALEPDHIRSLSRLLLESGLRIIAAVSPSRSTVSTPSHGADSNGELSFETTTGDLEDLEIRMELASHEGEGADLILSNSHAASLAKRTGVPILRTGFPIFDRYGETTKVRAGYRGSANLLFEISNLLLEGSHGNAHENRNTDLVGYDSKDCLQ